MSSNKEKAAEAKNRGNAALQAKKYDEAIAAYTEVSLDWKPCQPNQVLASAFTHLWDYVAVLRFLSLLPRWLLASLKPVPCNSST